MDKLSELKAVIDGILDDDHVVLLGDGSYEVRRVDGSEPLRVRKLAGGEWTVFFESGHAIPHAPRDIQPNKVVAWALL